MKGSTEKGSSELDAALSGIVRRQVPGVSIAVVSPDGVQSSNAVGVADSATARPAPAVTQLAERGALDLRIDSRHGSLELS